MLSAGLVVLIHHTGKDASKGARGHSSLFAALDGAIEVEHNATGRSWTIAKSKDGEGGTTFPFKLRVHHLGKDADGDDVTSCTVELAQGQIFQTREPTGKQQKPALRQLKAVLQKSADLGKAGCGVQTKCLPVEEAIKAIAITLTTVDKNKRNNRAKVVLDGLITGGTIKTGLDGDDGWVWL